MAEPDILIAIPWAYVRRSPPKRQSPCAAAEVAPLAPTPPAPPPIPRLPIGRPGLRGDCLPGGFNAVRPCHYAGCPYSLLLDVDRKTGEIRHDLTSQILTLPYTCALDVADITDETGRSVKLRSLTQWAGRHRERVRQLELRALDKMQEELGGRDAVSLDELLTALEREPRRERPPGD